MNFSLGGFAVDTIIICTVTVVPPTGIFYFWGAAPGRVLGPTHINVALNMSAEAW